MITKLIILTGKLNCYSYIFWKIYSQISLKCVWFFGVLHSTFYHFHFNNMHWGLADIFKFTSWFDFTPWIWVSTLLIVFLYIISVYVPWYIFNRKVCISIYCMIFVEISPTECSYPVCWRIDRKTEISWWKTGKGRSNSFYARRVISLLDTVNTFWTFKF